MVAGPTAWCVTGQAQGAAGHGLVTKTVTGAGAGAVTVFPGAVTVEVTVSVTVWMLVTGGAVTFFVSSLSITIWNILIISLRQSVIPGRLLGRVHGTWRTLLWGAMPVGSLIGRPVIIRTYWAAPMLSIRRFKGQLMTRMPLQ